MDDLTLRYYDAKMRYLLEADEELAGAHSDRAAMLKLEKPRVIEAGHNSLTLRAEAQ